MHPRPVSRPMAPRAATLLLLALLAPGCLGGVDWAVTGVSATAVFLDEPWDADKAEAGFREAGLTPRRVADTVTASDGTTNVVATRLTNGTAELTVAYASLERAASREEAETRAKELIQAREAQTEALVAAFERGSGWTRDLPLRWNQGVLHGD